MIKNPRNLLWILPLVVYLTSPLWKPSVARFLAPRGGYDPKMSTINTNSSQNFIMDTVTLTLTSKGSKEWEIDAERAFTGKSDREIEMVDVNAFYVGKDKDPTRITSRKGQYLIDDRHLILIEDVVIRKPLTNEVLYTDLLHYYDATKMAVSPGNIDLLGPQFNIQAGRMDYDLSTDGYDFSGRVIVDL